MTKLNKTEEQFKTLITGPHRSPFAVQKPGDEWKTVHKHSNDYHIKNHLAGKAALGLNARWYPQFINFDLDHPAAQAEAVFDRLDELEIRRSQYVLISSPRWRTNGNFRIYIRPTCNGKPATFGLNNKVWPQRFDFKGQAKIEIYPQENRVDRQPFGFSSEVLIDGKPVILTLEEKIKIFEQLEETEIEHLPFMNLRLDAGSAAAERKEFSTLRCSNEVSELIENGLQAAGERHEAIFQILYSLWRQNILPEDATAFVKNWIREKHNEHSKAARVAALTNDWRDIDSEIERRQKSVWKLVRHETPDSIQNNLQANTAEDLKIAAEMFSGNAVRQKELFNLIGYCRRRSQHQHIYIPATVWKSGIASYKTYISLQEELEEKGLLTSIRHYRVGQECRKYKLNLNLNKTDILQFDSRNITDIYDAYNTVYNGNRRAIEAVSGIDRTTLWRNK
jgi:hypothetical protein